MQEAALEEYGGPERTNEESIDSYVKETASELKNQLIEKSMATEMKGNTDGG
jgi:hypothetical protein